MVDSENTSIGNINLNLGKGIFPFTKTMKSKNLRLYDHTIFVGIMRAPMNKLSTQNILPNLSFCTM